MIATTTTPARTVLSSYGASMVTYRPPSLLAPGFVFLQADGTTTHWSRCLDARGCLRWGRHLSTEEQVEAQTRLLAAPGLAGTLAGNETAPVVLGLDPTGACLGRFGDMPILPLGSAYWQNGWLSPEGLWIPCAIYRHLLVADALHPDEGRGLETDGWVHISRGVPIGSPRHEVTEAQAGWLLQHLPGESKEE